MTQNPEKPVKPDHHIVVVADEAELGQIGVVSIELGANSHTPGVAAMVEAPGLPEQAKAWLRRRFETPI